MESCHYLLSIRIQIDLDDLDDSGLSFLSLASMCRTHFIREWPDQSLIHRDTSLVSIGGNIKMQESFTPLDLFLVDILTEQLSETQQL